MESIALNRVGLQNVPVNSLKGYFGHTMGAAGILETILSMASVDDGTLLGTRGYSQCGVSCPLDISPEPRETTKRAFAKLLSGFVGEGDLPCASNGLLRRLQSRRHIHER